MSLQEHYKPRKIDRKRPSSRQIDDQQDNLHSVQQQQQLLMQRQSQSEPNPRPKPKDRLPTSRMDDDQQDDQQLEPMQQAARQPQKDGRLQTIQVPMEGDDDQPRRQRRHPTPRESRPSYGQPSYDAVRRPPRKGRFTRPADVVVWFVGACCALLWTIIILGGVVVLIVYLVFRPRSPLLDIQGATLNAAYLDTGALLNADITVLANFSNPNRKVHVAFSYVQVDLYFMDTMIATQAVEPFAERPGESALKSLHVMASEVPLPRNEAEEWQRGTSEEGVALELMGRFRTRSDFGRWLHFTYWLYGHCTIVIGAPPSGVLLSSRCRTKR